MSKRFILKKITLYNIFNYRKENIIDFTTDKDGNIFLFDVENGGGKTSLFLAIKWGFYGNTGLVEYIKDGEKLTNKDFMNIYEKESDGRFYVEISFEYDGDSYILLRKCDNPRSNESELTIKKNGKVYSGTDAEDMAMDMVPPDYGDFFMFNGETLQDIANNQKSTKKIDGVLKLLGLKQMSDLELTLEDVKKEIISKLNRCGSANERNDDLQRRINDKQIEIENQNSVINRNTELKRKYEESLSIIDEQLDKYKNSEDLVKQYNEVRALCNKELAKCNVIIGRINGKSEDAFSIFINNDISQLIERNQDSIDEYLQISSMTEEEAQILQLQTEVLGKHMDSCPICNSSISDSEKEKIAESIRQSKERLDRYNKNKEKLSKIRYENSVLKRCKDKVPEKLQEDLDLLAEAKAKYVQYDRALKTINKQLAQSTIEEIKKLADDKVELTSNIALCDSNIKTANNKLLILTSEMEKLIAERARGNKTSVEYKKLNKQREYCENIISNLKVVIDKASKMERDKILEKANDVFVKLTNKPDTYDHLEYTDDKSFSMDIILKNGMTLVKPSSGEKHILAISFLISLSLNTERLSPMMMDTPLSRLDPKHSVNIGRTLATLENQVIFLAQPSELSADVKDSLMPSVAKEFTADLTPDNVANIYEVI